MLSCPPLPISLPTSSATASPPVASGGQSPGQKKDFNCNVCSFKGRDNYGLVKHKKSMHTLKVPALACPRYYSESPLRERFSFLVTYVSTWMGYPV